MRFTESDRVRFYSYVLPPSAAGCREWAACRKPNGYGQFRAGGRNHDAHRVAFVLAGGRIPRNQVVMHSCDNRACCAPEHLRAGTQRENIGEMVTRRRHPNQILTEGQEQQIVARYLAGEGPYVIAHDYPVSGARVWKLLNDRVRRVIQ